MPKRNIQPDSQRREIPVLAHDVDATKAVQRVYEKYGPDLSAFYRDVKQEIALSKCEYEKFNK